MTIGPAAGDTLPPPSKGRAARVSRRTAALLLVTLALLGAGVFGIRAVWPASSSARQVTEAADNGYFLVIDQAGEEVGSGSATRLPEEGDDVRVEVWGSPAPGGALRVDATMANASQSVLEFHDGLRMVVAVTREGAPWRTAEIVDPRVTKLAPGATWAGDTTIPDLRGPGEFVLSATVETWRQ